MKSKSIQILLFVVTIFITSCQKDLVMNTEQFPVDKLSLAASDAEYTFLISWGDRTTNSNHPHVLNHSESYTFPLELTDNFYRRYTPNLGFSDPFSILASGWLSSFRDEMKAIAVVPQEMNFNYATLHRRISILNGAFKVDKNILHVQNGNIVNIVPLQENVSFYGLESPYKSMGYDPIYGSNTLYSLIGNGNITSHFLCAINMMTGQHQQIADITAPASYNSQIHAVSTWEKDIIAILSLKQDQANDKTTGFVRLFQDGIELTSTPIKILEVPFINYNTCYSQPIFQVARGSQGLYTFYVGLPCSTSLGGGGFIDFYQCKPLNNQQTFLGRMTLDNSDDVDITRKDYDIAPY